MGFLNVKDSLPKELEYFSSKRKAIISLGVPCFHAREILRFLLPAPHRKIPPTFKHSLSLIDLLSCKIWNVQVIRASSLMPEESCSVKSELLSYNLHGLYLIYVC